MYQIFYIKKAIKELSVLDFKIQKKIKDKIALVALDPYHPNNNLKQLSGVKNGFRLRVDRYRVLFLIITENKQIIIAKIFLKKSKKDYNQGIKSLLEISK